LALLEEVDEVYATKGKQVVRVDLEKDRPDRATLTGLLLGPTGNLRAPAVRAGRTLIVGFDEATYAKIFR
jgi:arsenate reductase-like glutaredoxin family protein